MGLGQARPLPDEAAAAELDALVAALYEEGDPFDRVAAMFARHLPLDTCGEAVAALIDDALGAGRPASMLRLGDGEGAVMAAGLRRHPALTDHAAREVGLRHLGDEAALTPGSDALPELLAAYRAAIEHADVLGIPDRGSLPLVAGLPRGRGRRAYFGLVSVYEYLEALGADGRFASRTSAASMFHQGLLDHLPDLVRGRDVVVVTCHRHLPEAITARLGARSARLVEVPLQGFLRRDASGSTGHFPDRYREVGAELRAVAPGTLVLVGAGILAEPYCEAARAAGAVAVDVGSVLDIWAGVRTRVWGHTPDVMARYGLV